MRGIPAPSGSPEPDAPPPAGAAQSYSLRDYDYALPPDRIAQHPVTPRDSARLLLLERATGRRSHLVFREFPAQLRQSDLVVWNEARVIPARLHGTKEGTGGRVEVLLLERASVGPSTREEWSALLSASRPLKEGMRVLLPGGAVAEVLTSGGGAAHRILFRSTEPVDSILERFGEVPLPPYIRRDGPPGEADRERYQTIYARARGAVAAPTAGLHFTPEVVAELDARGIERRALVLQIGYGTFAPIETDDIRNHRMHEEAYAIPERTAEDVTAALRAGRRVVAVGTTTVRALEAAAARAAGEDPPGSPVRIPAGTGRTALFIAPGHRFRAVGALLTNFHLPRSSLLALVAAFAGREEVLEAYREAVGHGYRFFSYGDAMLAL